MSYYNKLVQENISAIFFSVEKSSQNAFAAMYKHVRCCRERRLLSSEQLRQQGKKNPTRHAGF